jgi:hypothetical protein
MRWITVLAMLAGWAAAAEEAQYEVQVKVYKVTPANLEVGTPLETAVMLPPPKSGEKVEIVDGVAYRERTTEAVPLDWSRTTPFFFEGEPQWGGKVEPEMEGVVRLGSPTMTVITGHEVGVEIKGEQPVEYFEKVRDDLYRLREVEPYGISIKLLLEPAGDYLNVSMRMSARLPRTPAPDEGEEGEAGSLTWATKPPVVAKSEMMNRFQVKPGMWMGLSHPLSNEESIVVLLKTEPFPRSENGR